jgi:aldose 1-epimerase
MSPENVLLKDSASGAEVEVLVGLGFNCHRFCVPHRGQPVELLWAEPTFTSGKDKPSRSGVPILFPFPGRIRGTEFRWRGHNYPLTAGDAFGNAIHGFVHTRPWRAIERGPARLVGEFHAAKDDPTLLEHWPSDFRLTATYELSGRTLKMHYRGENLGAADLPCGLGTHPYFRVPLGGGDANACVAKIPAAARWELNQLLPTGRKLPLDGAAAYAAGRPFGQIEADDVFSDLTFENGWFTASLADPQSGLTTTIRMDDFFPECVVYTPPHREAICIEPYSLVPNAAELLGQGIDSHLRVLKPGESFDARVEISASA